MPLLSPDPHRLFTASTFPRFDAEPIGCSFGLCAIDTIKFGEQWELNGGFRWDSFQVALHHDDLPTTTPGLVTGNDIKRTDQRPSYRGAIVYKPQANGSVYFAYGTSFNPSTEVAEPHRQRARLPAQQQGLAPEENETFEVGTKWDVLDGSCR